MDTIIYNMAEKYVVILNISGSDQFYHNIVFTNTQLEDNVLLKETGGF